jgi:selenide,water dikinase
MDEVWQLIKDECVPGGSRENRRHADTCATWHDQVDEPLRLALCDAQTSGGLLIATPGDKAQRMLSALHEAGVDSAAIIGEISSSADVIGELSSSADVIGEIEDGPSPCIFVDK